MPANSRANPAHFQPRARPRFEAAAPPFPGFRLAHRHPSRAPLAREV